MGLILSSNNKLTHRVDTFIFGCGKHNRIESLRLWIIGVFTLCGKGARAQYLWVAIELGIEKKG